MSLSFSLSEIQRESRSKDKQGEDLKVKSVVHRFWRRSSRTSMRWSSSALSTAAAIGIIIAVVGILASHIDRKPVTPINPNVILNKQLQRFTNARKQTSIAYNFKTFMNH